MLAASAQAQNPFILLDLTAVVIAADGAEILFAGGGAFDLHRAPPSLLECSGVRLKVEFFIVGVLPTTSLSFLSQSTSAEHQIDSCGRKTASLIVLNNFGWWSFWGGRSLGGQSFFRPQAKEAASRFLCLKNFG